MTISNKNNEIMPEIMAPAGSFESLSAAIKAGCDSVYFGVAELNMRSGSARNFTSDDLPEIVNICSEKNVRTYLALNVIIYDDDIEEMKRICDKAKDAGITAIIATDMSAILYARSIGLTVHCSTQLNVSNIETIKFFSKYADTIVLARELSLEQIESICKKIIKEDIRGPSGELLRIEVFVHGALCVAISGKCYMSLAAYNSSANRGKCLQPCRRKYRIYDDETGTELKIDNQFVMSPKDLCTIKYIDKLIEAGISVFKIEGRGRSPDYVYTVTGAYKKAIELYNKGEFTKEKAEKMEDELCSVFNRGFWDGGYYLGTKLGEWSGTYGSKATKEKIHVGKTTNYYKKIKIAEFKVLSSKIKIGDEVLFTGNKTGIVKTGIKSIHTDSGEVKSAKKGEIVCVPVDEQVRENDSVFLIKDRKNK